MRWFCTECVTASTFRENRGPGTGCEKPGQFQTGFRLSELILTFGRAPVTSIDTFAAADLAITIGSPGAMRSNA
jgi:hypothetical protein